MKSYSSEKDLYNASHITNELLPCPFCGNTNILTYGRENEETGFLVYNAACGIIPGCGAGIFVCLGGVETAEKARMEVVKKWNTRTIR